MPDDLYERDILTWSEHQADLLRRIARGERVNDVDWAHIVEEIEDVGLSELNAVHLLKLASWPDHACVRHWREDVAAFQAEANQRFAPSMRQLIDLDRLHGLALKEIKAAEYGSPPPAWLGSCPFSLDDLLNDEVLAMERQLARIPPSR